MDNHRRHSRSKRTRKLDEVERLTEIERLRKAKEIEEKATTKTHNNQIQRMTFKHFPFRWSKKKHKNE